jgi:hypothetical protein
MTYLVYVEVRKSVEIEVEADSIAQAREIGNAMQTTYVEEHGSVENVESEVIDISRR